MLATCTSAFRVIYNECAPTMVPETIVLFPARRTLPDLKAADRLAQFFGSRQEVKSRWEDCCVF
jgi:hypothetical protein